MISSKDNKESLVFLSNENNYESAIKYILKSSELQKYFLPLIPKEKIALLLSENDKAATYIIDNFKNVEIFKQVCESIIKANTNKKLVKKIRTQLTEAEIEDT